MAVGEHIRDVDTKTVRDLVRAVKYDLGYEFIIGEKHDVVFETTGWIQVATTTYYLIVTREE